VLETFRGHYFIINLIQKVHIFGFTILRFFLIYHILLFQMQLAYSRKAEGNVWFQANYCGICGGLFGTRLEFPLADAQARISERASQSLTI
jgi:hypothetical protein